MQDPLDQVTLDGMVANIDRQYGTIRLDDFYFADTTVVFTFQSLVCCRYNGRVS